MHRSVWLLAFIVLARSTTIPAQDTKEPRFENIEAMVPMRDGVKLYTTVHVPKNAKGPLPIILIRTPYGIDGRAERNFRELRSRNSSTTGTPSRSRTFAGGSSRKARSS